MLGNKHNVNFNVLSLNSNNHQQLLSQNAQLTPLLLFLLPDGDGFRDPRQLPGGNACNWMKGAQPRLEMLVQACSLNKA